MASRTTTRMGGGNFLVDPTHVRVSSGAQIDWANVSDTNADGKKFLPAGTVVGSLAGGGLLRKRVVTTNPAIGLLATDAIQDDRAPDSLSGYGVIIGAHVYENLLPDATGGPPKTLAGAIKTELGALFTYETYGDNRS